MLDDPLTSTAFGAALVFGFRHGFDWDHLAALTDLTGSQTAARRSMWLAWLYAVGHAAMVVALGLVAILFAGQVPSSVDAVAERLVGASLLALAVWMSWTAVRTRGAPPLRSRWMLVIGAVRHVTARRRAAREELVVVEHDHHHHHGDAQHEHPHLGAAAPVAAASPVPASVDVEVAHRHLHRHVAVAPQDPFTTYSGPSAFGIGVLHGVGAETPTQVLVFAAAANASGRVDSVGILACFVVGLVVANTLVAAASVLGFRSVLGHRVVAMGLAAVTVAFSLVLGTLLLFGQGASLGPFPGT